MMENQYQIMAPTIKQPGLIYEGTKGNLSSANKNDLQNMCNDLYKNIVPKEAGRTRNNFYAEGISNLHDLSKRLQTALPISSTFYETKSLLSRDYPGPF